MAYSDVAIDVTAKQIEDAVKAVPELQEADETTSERLDELDQQMSQKVDYSAFRSNVEQLQAQIDNKQENLVAGNGIEIDGNVISASLDIAGTQGIEVLDGYDEHADPIKFIKLTEETYNLIQQISNKENKLLSADNNIELFETTDEFGNNVTEIKFGYQAKGVVESFGNLEYQVENKVDKRNLKLIRTFIIGDETTYRTHDIVTYLDDEATQIQKIVLTETDDNRPIKVKYMFARVFLPERTDITSNYGVAFLPYGLISTDEDGFARGSNGYKLCSSSEIAKSANDNYSMVEVEFTDNFEYVFGRFTGYATGQDLYAGVRNWAKNPYYLNGDGDDWGKIIMQKLCNAFNFHVYTSGVAFPSGTKVEIFGEEVEQ